jgi:O-antigen/teichoic acid export membrane protein
MAAAIALAPESAARVVLHDPALADLSVPIALGLVALSANTLSTAALRGLFAIGRANLLQLVVMGLLPILVFAGQPISAAQALRWQGISGVILAGSVWALLVGWSGRRRGEGGSRRDLRELLRFGITRVPGEFALVGLFSLPPLLALRTEGPATAGHVSFALSIVTLFASVFAPIGLVLLPAASRLSSRGDLPGLRRQAKHLTLIGVPLAIAGVGLAWPLAGWFTTWYLGPAFVAAVPLVRLALLGVIPYVVYILFRNLLDAIDARPVNSRNLMVALAVCLLPALWWRSAEALMLAVAASLTVLGTLSAVAVRVRLRRSPSDASRTDELASVVPPIT